MTTWWENLAGLVAQGSETFSDSLLFEVEGETFEVPSEGQESHTAYGSEGMSVYADLDGDGEVDRVSTVGYDGSYRVYERADCEDIRQWGWADTDECSSAEEWGTSAISPARGDSSLSNEQQNRGWTCVEWG